MAGSRPASVGLSLAGFTKTRPGHLHPTGKTIEISYNRYMCSRGHSRVVEMGISYPLQRRVPAPSLAGPVENSGDTGDNIPVLRIALRQCPPVIPRSHAVSCDQRHGFPRVDRLIPSNNALIHRFVPRPPLIMPADGHIVAPLQRRALVRPCPPWRTMIHDGREEAGMGPCARPSVEAG